MRLRSSLWITAVVAGIVATAHAAPGARTFDRVTYTVPEGWKVEETGRGLVSISRLGAGSYCLVAIYAGQPASGDLAASFSAEWKNVALQSIDPMPEPTHTIGDVGNTRAALGGAAATIKGEPATAVLIVLDAGSSVVPIAILSSSTEAFAACNDEVKTMLASLVVQPADAAAEPAPGADGGKLVIPPPERPLTLTDLAGEWQHEDRISTTYVDRQTGAYAGSDNLAFRETWVINVTGGISSHFFAIRNGQRILDETTGTIKLSDGRILDVRIGSPASYVVRGWLELPSMTVLKIVGPFYDGEIPQEILDNPEQGGNLNQHWIRKTK
jgi:hypothetical protein